MRHILLFIVLSVVFNPKKLLCQSNETNSLIQQAIKYAKTNQNDSLDYVLEKLVPKVVGNELDSLLRMRQKSQKNLIDEAKIVEKKKATKETKKDIKKTVKK